MSTASALDQFFDAIGDCLSIEAAAKLQDLRVSEELQVQLDNWADQNTQGLLSEEDRQQYESVVRALNFVAILQAKGRKRVATSRENR